MLSEEYKLRDKLMKKAMELTKQAIIFAMNNNKKMAVRRAKQSTMILSKVPDNVPEDKEDYPF